MINQVRPAIVLTLLLTGLTGLGYPLAMTGIGQAVFPHAANGSQVEVNGVVVGSALIGQSFTSPDYFWSRPSATGGEPYNGLASAGSNYGPTDARLVARVAEATSAFGGEGAPADAVTTSASGLDPHITPANARQQAGRVAEARGLAAAEVSSLVERMTESPALGIFGEPRVNVLALNMALDQMAPKTR